MDDNPDSNSNRRGSTVAAAFAVFLLVCGLVLLVLGGPVGGPVGGEEPEAPAPEPRSTTTQRLQKAYRHMEQAEIALEGSNYGDVRVHLRHASGLVTAVLAEDSAERP